MCHENIFFREGEHKIDRRTTVVTTPSVALECQDSMLAMMFNENGEDCPTNDRLLRETKTLDLLK